MKPEKARIPTAFVKLWLGQMTSQIGSGLTNFGLGIWVVRETQSATAYAFVVLAATAPSIVLTPLLGSLLDRWNRRNAMIVGNGLAAVGTLVMLSLVAEHRMWLWALLPLLAFITAATNLQSLAYATSLAILVPKERLTRANGMVQVATALPPILSPLVAGLLVVSLGLPGLLTIDIATYVIAVTAAASVRIPTIAARSTTSGGTLFQGVQAGWSYISARRGFSWLLVLSAVTMFTFGSVMVLLPPLVLAFTGARQLGAMFSFAGIGGVLGGIVVSVWDGPHAKVSVIVLATITFGICAVTLGVRPSTTLVTIGLFGLMFLLPLIEGYGAFIWQVKTPLEIQGRVFALRRAVASASLPAAYLIAGPLADHVFEPMLSSTGRLAGSLGLLIGVGKGRGLAAFVLLVSTLPVITAAIAWVAGPLRRIDADIPDVLTPLASERPEVSVTGAAS